MGRNLCGSRYKCPRAKRAEALLQFRRGRHGACRRGWGIGGGLRSPDGCCRPVLSGMFDRHSLMTPLAAGPSLADVVREIVQ